MIIMGKEIILKYNFFILDYIYGNFVSLSNGKFV